MKVARTLTELKDYRRAMVGSVGFVPTMGYLHEGHLSLARVARAENDHVAASIFVNPTQFGPREDLSTYPRDLDRDLAMLEAERTDLVFVPRAEDIYPVGFVTFVDVTGPLTQRLEAESRPGHFRGVTTVVNKLFNLVEPSRAYFGQKDAQQALVIQRMAADLNVNVQVVVMPTIREPDGLAMSSRNNYLKGDERRAANVLYRSLMRARELYLSGERDAEGVRREMRRLIESEPLSQIDYVSIADADDLSELESLNRRALVSLAVRIGKTRLIDNIMIG